MTVFLIWNLLLLLAMGAYFVSLRRKQPRYSGFRIKLTILFFLFALAPMLPATFFISTVITRSADMLLVPGMEQALNSSIRTISSQSGEKGRTILNNFPRPPEWSPALLTENSVTCLAAYRYSKQKRAVLPSCFPPFFRRILLPGLSRCGVSDGAAAQRRASRIDV